MDAATITEADWDEIEDYIRNIERLVEKYPWLRESTIDKLKLAELI